MSVCVSVDVGLGVHSVDVGACVHSADVSMCVHRQIISRFPGHTTLRMVPVAGT